MAHKTKGNHIIKEEHTEELLKYPGAVILFMGAGDVQKFQAAYEKVLDQEEITDAEVKKSAIN